VLGLFLQQAGQRAAQPEGGFEHDAAPVGAQHAGDGAVVRLKQAAIGVAILLGRVHGDPTGEIVRSGRATGMNGGPAAPVRRPASPREGFR
jgi:hypothetical protein